MMLQVLWLVPTLPLIGFVILALFGGKFSWRVTAWLGVGFVGAAAIVAAIVSAGFLSASPFVPSYTQIVWDWMDAYGLDVQMGLYLDALSLVMMLAVVVVGFLIQLYSVEFMAGGEGYSRFFAYMNLFVSSMLVLLLGNNLVVLFLGWEGVGLCSYLLIGFWYKEPENGYAARKAFVVTRVGDMALFIGLLLIFNALGTLDIQELMQRAALQWMVGSGIAAAASALILGGALAKSAQLPLQTWLPDAMLGPTPVSALIHAATMVTAGVYLIARTNILFTLAPAVQETVAIIGAVTIVYAGFSGVAQRDIKRVLAYSTISQIGYMFLALGVGAWSAAIFHFMTHAFFKSLLFLSAGVVLLGLQNEHDIFKMGGLRRELPLAFWTFLIGAASLSAVPVITAGYYSKDLIISLTLSSVIGNVWLWLAALLGAFMTSLYAFRVLFIAFYGEPKRTPDRKPHSAIRISLMLLAFLSIVGGVVWLPADWVNFAPLGNFLQIALPAPITNPASFAGTPGGQLVAPLISLFGILVAYVLYLRQPRPLARLAETPKARTLNHFWFVGWGFDWLYDRILVWPFVWFAQLVRNDPIDLIFMAIAWLNRVAYRLLSWTQTGRIRLYVLVAGIGAAILIAIGVFR